MTVKIVTDSLSDITSEIAREFDITVVPLTVLFGHDSYLDGVTITSEQFYDRLINGKVWPTTTQPTPALFAETYNKLLEETDEILVIDASSKLSGTYQSALSAKTMVNKKARIEVIDTQKVAMSLGLIAISTARKARRGASMDELVAYVNRSLDRAHFAVYFDTLQYLAKGGRIGKAKELMGSVLSIKQILTIKDGEMAPLARKRSLVAGMDYLVSYVQSLPGVAEIAIEHTTNPTEGDKLEERLRPLLAGNNKRIFRTKVSPVLGVYSGPGAIALGILESGD
jgi:DegV family protein with EDD domain